MRRTALSVSLKTVSWRKIFRCKTHVGLSHPNWVSRGTHPDSGRRLLVATDESLNICLKTWQLKTPGYGAKLRSYVTSTSC